MPVYEYYCENCNGIFEQLRPIREASEPWPCPECNRQSPRVMPTSFAAFTYREGYPRRIPDKGTYWHFGQEVSKPISGPVRPNEHPEINKREPEPVKTKGERGDEAERKRLEGLQKAAQEKERQAAIEAYERKERAKETTRVPPRAKEGELRL
jgi:putative FmdB family regulatory protein